MSLVYRKATHDDLLAIVEMVKNAIVQMEKVHVFQWDSLYPTKEDFAKDIVNQCTYVGMMGTTIAVVFVLNQTSDKEYEDGDWKEPLQPYYVLHKLCVNPYYQKRGIAKETLSFIENEVKVLGCEAIRLDVFSENPTAVALYQRCGYEKVGFADWRKGRFFLMEKYL